MKQIPLTRARHAANFAAVLREKGVPTDRFLERSHLPVDLLEDVSGDSVLSALSMLDFAETAATNSGIRDLGYWAGLAPIEAYGGFGTNIVHKPTLYTALRTYCTTVRTECSEANYYMRRTGPTLWFCHHQGENNPFLPQHELYAAMIMTQVIRLALGPQWKPARIRLQNRDEDSLGDNDFLTSANIAFSAAETGIEFRPADLAKPVMQGRGSDRQSKADGQFKFPAEPLAALQLLIEMLIRNSVNPSLDVAAEMSGVDGRTLQRYLSRRGTTYSELVDRVRFDIVKPLLRDADVTMTDIAFNVGYSSPANFARSFKRLTGMPPSQYRKILLTEELDGNAHAFTA